MQVNAGITDLRSLNRDSAALLRINLLVCGAEDVDDSLSTVPAPLYDCLLCVISELVDANKFHEYPASGWGLSGLFLHIREGAILGN